MDLEQEPDGHEEGQELVGQISQETAHVDLVVPEAPDGMSEEERVALRGRAEELVEELSGAVGSEEMELIDSVTNVGIQAQRTGGSELDLLRVRVGEMLSQGGAGGDITSGLVDLRLTLNEINPDELAKPEVAAEIDKNWEQVKRPGIVTFVVDTSGSMAGGKLQEAKDGLIRALDAMAGNNQVGFISFDDGVNTRVPVGPLKVNRFVIADAVQKLKVGGSTALYDAIKVGIEMTDLAGGDPDAIRALVVLTDGQATAGATGIRRPHNNDFPP